MTAVTEVQAAAETGPVLNVTIKAAELVGALKNVIPFACTDKTLPAICGILIEVADSKVTLVATDRYTLATQVLDLDTADVIGEGSVFLPAETVKALTSVKVPSYGDMWLFNLRVSEDGSLAVRYPDASTATYPAGITAEQFPKWRRLMEQHTAPEPGEVPATVAYNPQYIARFAKVGGKYNEMRITPGASGKPSKIECGPVVALICPIKIPS